MIKSRFDTEKISARIGLMFSGFNLSPTAWTLMALIPSFFGFLSILSRDLFTSLVLFLLAGAMDAIDGAVARATKTESAFGAFLDGIVDRYVEIFFYVGILFYILPLEPALLLPNTVWISLLIFGALMPTYITAYSDHRKVVTDPEDHRKMEGLLGRAERLWLLYFGMLFGCVDSSFLVYIIALLAVLANITALQRLLFVVKHRKTGRA